MLIYKCLNCEIEVKWEHNRTNKYCTNKCQKLYESKVKLKDWLEGKEVVWIGKVPAWARRHIIELRGYVCQDCGINEWNEKPLVLEYDHVDGNSENNNIDNIRLICPNCHSQTDTYKAKNKGKGRTYRNKNVEMISVSLSGKGPD